MADYEDLPYVVIERRGGGTGAFVWGALLGAGVALLLAPRSGEETQREIRETARRLRTAAGERVDEARDSVTAAVDRTRGAVNERIGTVRDAVETRAEQARQAIAAGRDAARQARTELEQRVEEAKGAYRAGLAAARSPQPAGGTVVADVVITEVVVEADPADL
ncbi:MAG TPA: YtxH domain-containing protein [Longimicrobiaceae bacterium]|nr:YtxH domain-containing protein [Longimicrobiaceae bacterium]